MTSKELTVVITTYNRKGPLLEQLKSLEIQGLYDKYEIIVSDNNSDYDVNAWLKESLLPEFYNIVKVIRRPHNVGGDTNITLSFQLPKTEWMWLLSDDDVTEQNSIQTILRDIELEADSDVCWIKYSIKGHFSPNNDVVASSIESVFDFYGNNRPAGELIFMSNNVYRLPFLNRYFSTICMYNDTCMSQIILPLLAIKKDNKCMRFSSSYLTNYVPDRISYGLLYAYLRFGNVLYVLPLDFNRKEIKSYKRLFFFTSRSFISSLATIKDRNYRYELLKKVYVSNFSFFSFRGVSLLFYYIVLTVIGVNNWLKLRNQR